MATAEMLEALMTAEEFGQRPDPGHPEELVRGRIVAMSVPGRRHGYVCAQAVWIVRRFVEAGDLGRVLSNDSGIITECGPDTVRGADVAYYSFERLPRGPLSKGYGPEVPELVVEVRSPSDHSRDVQAKIAEYLKAGVAIVVVLDPESQTACVLSGDGLPRLLSAEQDLTLPELWDDFRVRVRQFFE